MFDAPKVMMAGLVEIALPTRTLRLCDGGFIYFDGQKFTSADEDFGSIESIDIPEEKAGDEAPSGQLNFLPVSTAAVADLSQPAFQGSPIKFWLASVDEATGEIVGDPELLGDCELDTTVLKLARGRRVLEIGFISVAERMFNINEGNVLSTRFHQSVFTGELGFDNATGIGTAVAWGVAGPPRGSATSGAGGGGGFTGPSGSFSDIGMAILNAN